MKRKSVQRTVQYWQLVDARDGGEVADVDWWGLLAKWTGEKRAVVDGQGLVGNVHPVQGHDQMLGVVLASEKDYLPNQRRNGTGEQTAMQLTGDDWNPVDNLYVAFLPFGNLFAVIAESVSSSRASKFAGWLNKVLGPSKSDPDFYWAAVPVIDPERAALLNNATGLRSLTIRAPYGSRKGTRKTQGFLKAISKKPSDIKGWDIELKISAVSADSDNHDREELLKYFEDVLGGLAGHETKAVVQTSGDDTRGATEIDLLHHRVTRKANVVFAATHGPHAHFAVAPVLQTIYEAYLRDENDLKRIFGRK